MVISYAPILLFHKGPRQEQGIGQPFLLDDMRYKPEKDYFRKFLRNPNRIGQISKKCSLFI